MQTLDLECPSCQEMLELDAGFAGGVCRCSNCGTLMTVPSDAGKAESLSRPSSTQRYEFDGDEGDDLASLGAATSGRSSSRGRSAAVEPGEYRTASGKIVKLDESVKVPTAAKRKQVRIATTIVFFGVVLAGVIAGVLVILLIINSGGGPGGRGGDGVAQYDSAANPYELPYANIAGLPLDGSVAVVVEASADSEEWAQDFADMVAAGLSNPASDDTSIAFFAAVDREASYSGIASTPVDELTGDTVTGWFKGLPKDGIPELGTAAQAAIDTTPDTLIFVISNIDSGTFDKWSSLLSGKEALAVHVVVIDGSSAESLVRNWLSQRDGGELVTFASSNFLYLKDQAE